MGPSAEILRERCEGDAAADCSVSALPLLEIFQLQSFVRINIFTLPNKEPPTLELVFIDLAAATWELGHSTEAL